MNKKTAYKHQRNLSLFQFSTEVINLFVILVSAILSRSLIMVMDLINSGGNTLRTGLTFGFSAHMARSKGEKRIYDVAVAEARISIVCDLAVLVGVLATLVFSVMELFSPRAHTDALLGVVGVKLICVILDSPLLYAQYKILRADPNRVAGSGFIASLGAFLFDLAAFLSLLTVYLTRAFSFSLYLSPTFAILIALYLLVSCGRHLFGSARELSEGRASKEGTEQKQTDPEVEK